MKITNFAKDYHEKMFPEYQSTLQKTDPELMERFDNFAFDEVINEIDLEDSTRFKAIQAVLIGCQGKEEYELLLPAALNMGVTPTEMKEIVYQSVAYVGMGRALPFLKILNEFLITQGIDLPLEGQANTTLETRREEGAKRQMEAFGDGMKGFENTDPEERRHINKWLVENCFGDYYTRSGLDMKDREMITFCFLAGQGGCESQLTSHVQANIRVGNNKEYLIKIVSQCLPFIGYPRSLNVLTCVENGYQNMKNNK